MEEINCLLPIMVSQMDKDFTRNCERVLRPQGLSKLHAFYLFCLYANLDGMKLNDITKFIGCDKANTSRALNDLEQKGIIEKVINNDIKKKYLVKLTEMGLDICHDFICKIREQINSTFSVLTDEEYLTFVNLLKKVTMGR